MRTVELPPVGGRLLGAVVHTGVLARLQPRAPVRGDPRLPEAGSAASAGSPRTPERHRSPRTHAGQPAPPTTTAPTIHDEPNDRARTYRSVATAAECDRGEEHVAHDLARSQTHRLATARSWRSRRRRARNDPSLRQIPRRPTLRSPGTRITYMNIPTRRPGGAWRAARSSGRCVPTGPRVVAVLPTGTSEERAPGVHG
jgi:hypothetical protein